jgi:hypothetical protein
LHTCIVVGMHSLPGGYYVLLESPIKHVSGAHLCLSKDDELFMDAADFSMLSKLWNVLHFQFLSYWAPVCTSS